ncbi:MAG: hypothetical protein J6R99_01845 [Alphaproteobacteria bacterium]|nr:hypothetical protein [Alphaproteobacteria bacterium]
MTDSKELIKTVKALTTDRGIETPQDYLAMRALTASFSESGMKPLNVVQYGDYFLVEVSGQGKVESVIYKVRKEK